MEGLAILRDGIYIDGTFGLGGHSAAILKALGSQGQLHAYDWDPHAKQRAASWQDKRFHFHGHGFDVMHKDMQALDLAGKVSGVLLDLGVSSPQLDQAERGFSFLKDGPLDMRMNPEQGLSARQWLQAVDETTLSEVICRLGQERHHRRIAHAIVKARTKQPFERTGQLASCIANVVPSSHRMKKHPATRTFQAIRIHLNQELTVLAKGLEAGLAVLAAGGRMAILSFHSLEHRLVKDWIKRHGPGHQTFSRLPFAQTPKVPRLKRIGRAQKPSSLEIGCNVRARSAQLRIIEKEDVV